MQQPQDRAMGSVRVWEIAVAVAFFAFGALVVWDSRRLGSTWASDGPQAGYFPFYIGLLLCISSAVNLFRALRDPHLRTFVTRTQGKEVLRILIPLAIYVLGIKLLGIYVASTLFIAAFMIWLGKYGWLKTAVVSIGVPAVFFLMFEFWFKGPMIKGPLETAFGLN